MKLNKICFLVNYNLYETKLYFVDKFSEALMRKGIEALVINTSDPKFIEVMGKALLAFKPELTAAFNALLMGDRPLCDIVKLPHWAITLDPLIYELQRVSHPAYIVSAVDRFECEFGKANLLSNVFFFPHAVESDLAAAEDQPRPYDVVMIGSCYDPYNLKIHWQRELDKKQCELMEEAFQHCIQNPMKPFWVVLDEILSSRNLVKDDVPYFRMAYYLDNYMRGIDRLELIRSIKDAEVHVFGGTCWRKEFP